MSRNLTGLKGKTRSKTGTLLLCAIILVLSSGGLARAQQQQAVLGWSASPATNVAGYILNYGTQSGNYTGQIDTGTNLVAVVTNLTLGTTYYFTASAYDLNGNLSLPSGEFSFTPTSPLQMTMSGGANPHAILNFTMATGHWYELQASSDLRNWSTCWQSGTAVSNTVASYSDLPPSGCQQRFYRFVQH